MKRIPRQLARVIIQPGRIFRELTLTHPGPLATTVLIGTMISTLAGVWASHHDALNVNPSAFTALAPFHILALLTGILLFSAVWHLSADLAGGAGRGLTLFLFVIISTLPIWLAGPSAWLLRVLTSLDGLYPIVLSVLLGWSLLLISIAVRLIYRFTPAKAAGVLFIPLAVLAGLATGLIALIPTTVLFPW
ncbi:hypothetical protein JXA80_08710 [bacterium]|nr:hypothetical protein [candidate division CSSED10-310 bacterium]